MAMRWASGWGSDGSQFSKTAIPVRAMFRGSSSGGRSAGFVAFFVLGWWRQFLQQVVSVLVAGVDGLPPGIAPAVEVAAVLEHAADHDERVRCPRIAGRHPGLVSCSQAVEVTFAAELVQQACRSLLCPVASPLGIEDLLPRGLGPPLSPRRWRRLASWHSARLRLPGGADSVRCW
jgi:hypothetical protein